MNALIIDNEPIIRPQARLDFYEKSEMRDVEIEQVSCYKGHSSYPAIVPALKRLPVRADYAVLLLRFEDILYAESRDKKVYVKSVSGALHRTCYTLTQLESLLPSDLFLRIHDSFIVSLDQVEELLFLGNHNYEIRLSDDRRLPVGRTRYAELRRRFGLDLVGIGPMAGA